MNKKAWVLQKYYAIRGIRLHVDKALALDAFNERTKKGQVVKIT